MYTVDQEARREPAGRVDVSRSAVTLTGLLPASRPVASLCQPSSHPSPMFQMKGLVGKNWYTCYLVSYPAVTNEMAKCFISGVSKSNYLGATAVIVISKADRFSAQIHTHTETL